MNEITSDPQHSHLGDYATLDIGMLCSPIVRESPVWSRNEIVLDHGYLYLRLSDSGGKFHRGKFRSDDTQHYEPKLRGFDPSEFEPSPARRPCHDVDGPSVGLGDVTDDSEPNARSLLVG